MTRCPHCGATNRDDAPWCGQCHASLGQAAPPEAPAPAAQPPAPPARQPAPPEAPAAQPAPPGTEAAGAGFRRRDGEVEWACVTCGTFNPIEQSACSACGTPLTARYETARPEQRPATQAEVAMSVVLPGSGHVLAGQPAAGVARAVLFVVWSGGALLILGGGGSALLAAPLLAGAALVWGGTLADVAALGHGGRELLRGRTLLWLVIGVTILLLIALAVGVAGLG